MGAGGMVGLGVRNGWFEWYIRTLLQGHRHFPALYSQHPDLQTLSNLKNAKKWAVCGQKALDRRGCLGKCAKNMREHLPGVVGTGVEAAGANMRCRHAADLAPRPFLGTRKCGRLKETRGRLAAQTRPARRV